MELFVQKEIKDKFDPLSEQQKENTEGIAENVEKINQLFKKIE